MAGASGGSATCPGGAAVSQYCFCASRVGSGVATVVGAAASVGTTTGVDVGGTGVGGTGVGGSGVGGTGVAGTGVGGSDVGGTGVAGTGVSVGSGDAAIAWQPTRNTRQAPSARTLRNTPLSIVQDVDPHRRATL